MGKKMNDQELLKQKIVNLNPPPIIIVVKNDKLLAENFIKDIKNTYFAIDVSGVNYSKIDLLSYDINNILIDLNTVPFLSSHKFIEVINPNKMEEKDLDNIKKYLDNPCKSSILMFVFDSLDKRTKLYNFFNKLDFFYDFNSLNDNEYLNYILEYAAKLKINIDKETVNFLFSYYEKDLLMIQNLLEKISINKDYSHIDMNNISELLIGNEKVDPFFIVQNIAQGNLGESLLGLEKLRFSKENAIKFLGLLMWQFRVIIQIRELLDNNLSDWDIRKQVNIYNERYEWMSKVARKKNLDFHITRMTRLLEVDEILKSSSIKDHFIFIEKAVYQSCFGFN